jgi:hypothetical protein
MSNEPTRERCDVLWCRERERLREKEGARQTCKKRGWTWDLEGLNKKNCWMTAAVELMKRPVRRARMVIAGICESSSKGISSTPAIFLTIRGSESGRLS